jgi:deoxyribodipyrimidine photo-lyase
MTRSLVWFRSQDLRLADHAPLTAAVSSRELLPLYVLDPAEAADVPSPRRAHRTQFWLDALHGLDRALRARGSRLVVVRGPADRVLPRLVDELHIDRVLAHRLTAPAARAMDERLRARLGPRLELREGETLVPPGSLRTGAGEPYTVFTAFARAWQVAAAIGAPLPAPRTLPPLPPLPPALGEGSAGLPTLAALGIHPNPSLLAGGEPEAQGRLRRFLRGGLARYASDRDRLDVDGTSRLSADLAVGTLSVRRVWRASERSGRGGAGAAAFQRELLWREFAYATLWDRPGVLQTPFRPKFAGFPWREDPAGWHAWVDGTTGYPVVDAAARQLRTTGFVPNRARMIAASFLTKHLLLDFRRGEAHYLEQLTDGDLANNDAGWQWSAGTGCDPQPYFRVFSPVLQGERFDPDGTYVRRWVTELARMPARYIHRPWEAPPAVLRQAGVRLGADYPHPIVAHRFVRERFLQLAQRHLGQERRGKGSGPGSPERGSSPGES